MTRRAHVVGTAAAVMVLSMCASAGAAEREVVRLDGQRRAPAVLTGGAQPAELRLGFELPTGASQGPDRWYLVRLHYRLWFARDSGRGFAWVTSDTNDRTAAQVEYTTVRRHGQLTVRRTTVDLTRGQRERPGRAPRDELTFTNYLQYEGVRPGANTWTIKLEQSGAARVERLEVLGDSAIIETDRTPFPLTLTATLPGNRPRAGERFTVNAVVAARPGRTVRDVVVRAQSQDDGAELIGPAEQRIEQLTGHDRTIPFTFLARQPGTYAVALAASSSANDPNMGVEVEVLPAAGATSAPAAIWVLVSIPALAMAAWLVASRRRRVRAR
jgi:hypothetical protein